MRPQRVRDRPPAQHAPAHAAADSVKARAARIGAGAILTHPKTLEHARPATARPGRPGQWLFDPAGARITVRNAEAVLAQLPVFLAGWPFAWERPADTPCEIDVRAQNGGFVISRQGPGASVLRFGSAFEAANGLAGALVSALVARDKDAICLHAAAVQIGRGVALFVGDSGAGKSSLSLNLATRGYVLFGDDRVGVRLGAAAAFCLGLMPKARLPLPRAAAARLHRFVETFSTLQTGDTAYLHPPAQLMAGFGEAQPLAAIFLLERRRTGPVRLAQASRPEVVSMLLRHSFAPHIAPAALIGRAATLAAAIRRYRLRFSASGEAAAQVAAALEAP